MRPGVYASVMRDRKTNPRRVNTQPHVYSWSRFFMMLGVGALLFVPGLIVTIMGIENKEELDEEPSDKVEKEEEEEGDGATDNTVLYKFIGPAALALGVALLCASGIYYCCWGFQSPVRRPSHKHKKSKKHGEHYDPLQAKNVTTISNHTSSAYTTVRSHGSPKRKSPRGNGDKVYHAPSTPDKRSDRHSNHAHHHHHHHSQHLAASRTASRSSLEAGSVRHNHHSSSSRHRGGSHSSRTASTSSLHARVTNTKSNPCSPTTTIPDNQVAFENTSAPLAHGESCSISLDIEGGTLEADKKY